MLVSVMVGGAAAAQFASHTSSPEVSRLSAFSTQYIAMALRAREGEFAQAANAVAAHIRRGICLFVHVSFGR